MIVILYPQIKLVSQNEFIDKYIYIYIYVYMYIFMVEFDERNVELQ